MIPAASPPEEDIQIDERRANIWRCPRCGTHHVTVTTIVSHFGYHSYLHGNTVKKRRRTFSRRCNDCNKVTRLASKQNCHIRASFPASSKRRARKACYVLNRIDDPSPISYVRVCGKYAVQRAQDIYAMGGDN